MQNETIKIEIKPADNVNGYKVVGIKGQTTAGKFTEQIEKLKRMFSSSGC